MFENLAPRLNPLEGEMPPRLPGVGDQVVEHLGDLNRRVSALEDNTQEILKVLKEIKDKI
jgi:hypothetical protein